MKWLSRYEFRGPLAKPPVSTAVELSPLGDRPEGPEPGTLEGIQINTRRTCTRQRGLDWIRHEEEETLSRGRREGLAREEHREEILSSDAPTCLGRTMREVTGPGRVRAAGLATPLRAHSASVHSAATSDSAHRARRQQDASLLHPAVLAPLDATEAK
jgi:hypothetical protein